MQKFPTMEELSTMSIKKLRLLDIMDAQQEAMVQIVINSKVLTQPVSREIKTSDVPNIRDGETEKKWQIILDERREAIRPKTVSMNAIVPDGEVVIPIVEESEVLPAILEKVEEVPVIETFPVTERWCNNCDSKGGRHRKDCAKNNK